MTEGYEEFSIFCETLDKVASTSSKNEKIEILSDHMRRIPKHLLPSTCRFILGIASTKGKLNVGWSLIVSALKEVTGLDEKKFRNLYLKFGDLGDVVEEALAGKGRYLSLKEERLTLPAVQSSFDSLAEIQGEKSVIYKRRILQGLLIQSSALEAKYLVKIILGDLRIGATEGIVLDSLAKTFNLSSIRDWYLILGNVGRLAEKLASGDMGAPSPEPFIPVAFMLPLPVQDVSEAYHHFAKQVFAEYKYDGIRLQAHIFDNKTKLFTRRMEDITGSFPEIASALSSMNMNAILDGEAVAAQGDIQLPFHKLQLRLHRRKVVKEILSEVPMKYFVFDILYANCRGLIDQKLSYRKIFLSNFSFPDIVRMAASIPVKSEEEIKNIFAKSLNLGYEGLVLKDPESVYTPGRRGGAWIKLKKEMETIDAVIVFAEWGNGKRAGLLSDYTFAVWDGDELKTIGKAYSGLTDEEIKDMTLRLKQLGIRETWNGIQVRPAIVLEVSFDSIQISNRHTSGFALRFPRIKRIREDKKPEDADTLDKVIRLYQLQVKK
ncbi:MAG: ATP-dependent DNA ligase [Nitrososphaerota archaeon]